VSQLPFIISTSDQINEISKGSGDAIIHPRVKRLVSRDIEGTYLITDNPEDITVALKGSRRVISAQKRVEYNKPGRIWLDSGQGDIGDPWDDSETWEE